MEFTDWLARKVPTVEPGVVSLSDCHNLRREEPPEQICQEDESDQIAACAIAAIYKGAFTILSCGLMGHMHGNTEP